MDSHMEGNFSNHINTKKISGTLIEHTVKGEQGVEGTVYRLTNATLLTEKKERKIGGMFVKKISDKLNDTNGDGREVLLKHLMLKRMGLPVVPTVRFDRETNTLLMTDISKEGTLEIIDNHNPLSMAKNKIVNIETLKQQIMEIAIAAYDKGNGVFLGPDAYSITVDENGEGRIYLLDLGEGNARLENGKVLNHDRVDWLDSVDEDFVRQSAQAYISTALM